MYDRRQTFGDPTRGLSLSTTIADPSRGFDVNDKYDRRMFSDHTQVGTLNLLEWTHHKYFQNPKGFDRVDVSSTH